LKLFFWKHQLLNSVKYFAQVKGKIILINSLIIEQNESRQALRYNVYVIELSKKVFTENRKFREANPQFNGVLQCLYVGMTSKSPAERFKQHKEGYINKKGHKISANIVENYGSYLRPSLYEQFNAKPMSRQEALIMEKEVAMDLRRKGYAVWFN
jgi:predicted GIY-YIG superfamily endonuclease